MSFFNLNADDELLIDGSVPINGVNNSAPPSMIDKNLAAGATNRLSQRDGLNRPRPGIIRLKQLPGPGISADSIHHLGAGVFLVNNGAAWYTYNNRTGAFVTLSGGPAYASGAQVYSALCNNVLYFSNGVTLNKYTNATTTFGVVTLPSPYLTASCPIQATDRLIYIVPNNNTIVVSDILDWEVFDPITQTLTIDPLASDSLVGQALWRGQTVALFRNGSTYIVETGPNLNVVDWTISRVSATIGCCSHGSIVQCGSDIYFLSETGRGVYSLSQAPTISQFSGLIPAATPGVWAPLSAPIQRYIDRINWSAVWCARATYWNDLYRLSVPLDGSTFNNFELVYSVSLNTWQGIWCIDSAGLDLAPRDYGRDRSDPNATALMLITRDGIISRQTYPIERRSFDQNIDATQQPIESDLLSRSFTWSETMNQVQPYSADIQFLESQDPVTVTAWGDRTIRLMDQDVPTTNYLLKLTIPGFPFDLDKEGFNEIALGLYGTGVCNELQLEFEGNGNWTLFQLICTAFESAPIPLS